MLKKLLLNFIRRFYQPGITYVDPFIKKWINDLVIFIIDAFVNGILIYVSLFCLVFVFNVESINLGTEYWHIPIIWFVLGITLWFIEKFYTFLRKGYTGGKK